jgi:hypothetical protein
MAAGFWAGFGKQVSTDYAKRQDTLDTLIKENLDNARLAKRDYAKRTGLADQILKSTQAIQSTYGLKDEQAIALAEAYGTDLPGLQMKLAETNDQLMSTSGVGLGAEQVMSYVNMTNELAPLEGMTKLQAIQKLMGLNVAELAKEANPKSEGSQTRSFIRAALAFDPQLQAAEQMESIKGPNGISYAELLEMQEAGFAPQDVYGGVTRGSGLAYDYTVNTAKQTANDYTKALSVELYDIDIDDTVSWNNLSMQDKTLDKKQARANIQGAGQALARLERSIVLENIGKDLSLSAFRRGVLDSIYDRIDNKDELVTLKESVANGTALKIVQATGGKLTDDDIDAIIAGTTTEEQKVEPTITAAASSADVTAASSADVTAAKTNVIRPVTKVDGPIQSAVSRMLAEQGIEAEPLGLSDIGMDRREAAYEDDSLPSTDIGMDRREAAYEDDTIKPLVKSIAAGAATSEWLDSLGLQLPSTEDLNTSLVSTNYNMAAGINSGLATAIDFITGFVGGAQETGASKALKKLSKDQAKRAAEVAAKGFTEYFSSEQPPAEVIKDVEKNYLEFFTSDEKKLKEAIEAQYRAKTLELQAMNEGVRVLPEEEVETGDTSFEYTDAPVPMEPIMAKPKKTKKAKKPKEMTSSDKARLKRAQEARELGKDTGLLEMLVEKYGIAIVQKEMGL